MMIALLKKILMVCLGITISSCESAETNSGQWVARVHDAYLYKNDLKSIAGHSFNAEDSTARAKQYIDSWVLRHLMIAAAKTHGRYDKADMERKILDYRYDLMVHTFLEQSVKAELDTSISNKEILAYYQENLGNFHLKDNMFRGKFIVIPKDAPGSDNLKPLILSEDPKDQEDLASYCEQFAKNCALDPLAWHKCDLVFKDIPLHQMPSKLRLLKKGGFIKIVNTTHIYYFNSIGFKCLGEPAPLACVRQNIMNIIIHKRKIDLVDKIQKKIFQTAKQNKDYTTLGLTHIENKTKNR